MNATQLVDILQASLLPFLDKVYPHDHRFQQGNDPKHTSRYAKEWCLDQGVNWWKTPAASPDLNPIENVQNALKDYLRKKPITAERRNQGLLANDDTRSMCQLHWTLEECYI